MKPALCERLDHRRVPDRKMICRDVAGDDCPRGDHSAVADRNAFQNDRPGSDETAPADDDRPGNSNRVVTPFPTGERMVKIGVGDKGVRANHRVFADGQGLGGAEAGPAHADAGADFKEGAGADGTKGGSLAADDRIGGNRGIDPDTLVKDQFSTRNATDDGPAAH